MYILTNIQHYSYLYLALYSQTSKASSFCFAGVMLILTQSQGLNPRPLTNTESASCPMKKTVNGAPIWQYPPQVSQGEGIRGGRGFWVPLFEGTKRIRNELKWMLIETLMRIDTRIQPIYQISIQRLIKSWFYSTVVS